MANAAKDQRTKARKDQNVRRSSHGHFESVADLVAHQVKVSPKPRLAGKEFIQRDNNWLTTDRRPGRPA